MPGFDVVRQRLVDQLAPRRGEPDVHDAAIGLAGSAGHEAASLEAGRHTGTYRLGTDDLLVDRAGNSTISMEDLAVALLDEAERPAHHQARFTVAY